MKFKGLLAFLVLYSAIAKAELPEYENKAGVAGSITSVGSDTLANLMTLWSQEFKLLYPDVKFQIQASGSSTAPPALTEGTATIGPMSRNLKTSERDAFIQAHGYPPTVIKVALDAIAIFVERRNALPGLTLQQVDSIFSATRFCGGKQSITLWSQLGVEHYDQSVPIRLFSRNSVSGTYGLFKIMALCDGDFTKNINEQPGSASVVLSVASSKGGMGYAAYGYKTAGVKALPIGEDLKSLVPLNTRTVRDQSYPFTRFLYLVVNKAPTEPLPRLVNEFLAFILSREGQSLVVRDGYFAIQESLLLQQRKQILSAK